jgi:LPS sulfotransferase NodH
MALESAQQAMARLKVTLGPARAYVEGAFERGSDHPRFLILTSGRTGSELLVGLLGSHPQITCDGEILQTPRLSAERLIEGRAARTRHGGKSAYGFKASPAHIYDIQHMKDPANWVRHLASRGWQVIHLYRANRLLQAFSWSRSAQTRWHHFVGEVSAFEPVPVDVMQMMGVMYVIEWTENQITELLEGVDHLSLCYEDDLEDPTKQALTVNRICERLGLDPAPTSSKLVRISPRHARDMVTNYDEVVSELRRNRFAEYAVD